MLYLVFKEPTPTEPGYPLPAALPATNEVRLDRFWGNLLRLLEKKNSCQSLARCFFLKNRLRDKKNCSVCFSEQLPAASLSGAGLRRPTSLFFFNSIHAPGVGYSNPLLRPNFSVYWLSRLCRATEPRARYLTRLAATYSVISAASFSNDTGTGSTGQATPESRLNLYNPPLAWPLPQDNHRPPDGVGHRHLSPLISKTPVV
jgi:hypothetical protein